MNGLPSAASQCRPLRVKVQLVRGVKPAQDLLFLRYALFKRSFTIALRRKPAKGPK